MTEEVFKNVSSVEILKQFIIFIILIFFILSSVKTSLEQNFNLNCKIAIYKQSYLFPVFGRNIMIFTSCFVYLTNWHLLETSFYIFLILTPDDGNIVAEKLTLSVSVLAWYFLHTLSV